LCNHVRTSKCEINLKTPEWDVVTEVSWMSTGISGVTWRWNLSFHEMRKCFGKVRRP